jgi:hypothetical protein
MKALAEITGVIVYMALAVLELAAFIAGFKAWFGFGWLVAFVIWALLVSTPFVATIVGILAAVKGWHWDWPQAIGVFGGLQILAVLLTGSISIFGLTREKKLKK